MKFAIITHVEHKKKADDTFAYEPYVREMNLWLKFVDQVQIVAPLSTENLSSIDIVYIHKKINQKVIPQFDITTILNTIKAIFVIPIISFKIFKAMFWADHIHLRCPGNIGFLGCFIQILFPSKPKTAKYAGNWDPNSKQPISYIIQKWILSNTFLTKNCKVLVYGEWENQSKNIQPFFTASYTESEIKEIPIKDLSSEIQFIFVGGFTEGKQPLISVKVIEKLKTKGYLVKLNMYGDGVERNKVTTYIKNNNLQNQVVLHGNKSKNSVKKAYQQSHFLIFISKSEGWPKVVAESMFWSCLPITTAVSCVPYMVNNGNRGALVEDNISEIVNKIEIYLNDVNLYKKQITAAKVWSQEYTMERFSLEIGKLL